MRIRLPDSLRERGRAVTLTLVIEILLLIALLTIGRSVVERQTPAGALTSITIGPDHHAAPAAHPAAASVASKAPAPAQETPRQVDNPTPQVHQQTAPPIIIPMNRNQMASLDISNLPQTPAPAAAAPKAAYGPPAPAGSDSSGDTPVVGTAPNGEPMYAARWVHEPYDSELRGYMQTADLPGWGLITCRTAPEFRVEDCQILDEYPQGSRIAAAAAGAAWQFRVYPPRKGGKLLVGSWVRIKIIEEMRRAPR